MRGGDRDAPAYFTIRLVLPIWLSPTIPTLSVMLQCAPQHAWYVSKHAASREERDSEQGLGAHGAGRTWGWAHMGLGAHVLSMQSTKARVSFQHAPIHATRPLARSLQSTLPSNPHARKTRSLYRACPRSQARALCVRPAISSLSHVPRVLVPAAAAASCATCAAIVLPVVLRLHPAP